MHLGIYNMYKCMHVYTLNLLFDENFSWFYCEV